MSTSSIATSPTDDPADVEDVPDVSAAWYREILSFAHELPGWVADVAVLFTEGVLVLFALAFLLAGWHARRLGNRAAARALLAPPVTVIAYAVSEWAKTLKDVERPCRTLPDVVPLATCPPLGDFSLPSNHATVAGAVVAGLLLTWRALGLVILPVAVLAAFSRVFVGVHYPHDVVLGFALGMLVGLVLLAALTRPAAKLVDCLRSRPRHPVRAA